jgi:hypothetical protein
MTDAIDIALARIDFGRWEAFIPGIDPEVVRSTRDMIREAVGVALSHNMEPEELARLLANGPAFTAERARRIAQNLEVGKAGHRPFGAPQRNHALLDATQTRLQRRLKAFFAERAKDVAAQIGRELRLS